jgi:outer membrane protein assembly factor BamB
MPPIFISYRRADSEPVANRVYDELAAHFGEDNVFIDRESILGGANFRETIFRKIDRSNVMLVLMGPQWATIADEDGKRLFQDGDVVRAEVEMGLRLRPRITVIPVLLDGARMADETDLPRSIRDIAGLNAPTLRSDPHFAADMAELIETIETIAPHEEAAARTLATRTRTHGPLSWFRQLSTIAQVLIGITITVLTLLLAALPVLLSSDQLTQMRESLGITTPVPITPSPAPITVAAAPQPFDAVQISLQNVANDPRGLLVAPSPGGLAVWGYSAAGGDLFALDIANGTPLSLGAEDDAQRFSMAAFADALTTALYYDGRWLWVGDSRNHRLLAFNPVTMENVYTLDLGDNGQPSAITHTDDTLWIALRDTDQLAAFTVDHETGSVEPACSSERLRVGAGPFALTAIDDTTVWVALSGDDQAQILPVSVLGCRVGEPVLFDMRIDDLAVSSDNTLWAASGGELWQIANGEAQSASPTGIDSPIQQVHSGVSGIWIVTDDGNLYRYNPQEESLVQAPALGAGVNDLLSYGVQLWGVTEDNRAVRYAIASAQINDAIAITAVDGALWTITSDGRLCSMDESRACMDTAVESTPVAMAAGTDEVWIALEDNRVCPINLEEGAVGDCEQLPLAPRSLTYADGRLWVTDGLAMLLVIDTASGQRQDLLTENFNVVVPSLLTYDGANIWFGHETPVRLVAMSYEDEVLREVEQIPLDQDTLGALAAGAGRLYAAGGGTVAVVNPAQAQVTHYLGSAAQMSALAVADGELWTLNPQRGALYHLIDDTQS